MGRILIDDFKSQKKFITWILMITIIGAVIGFAFGALYYCTGILLTSGACIIYFGCFFNYQLAVSNFERKSIAEDYDRIEKISWKKMQVRTKYVEILFVSVTLYILMSIAFIVDAYDHYLFLDPEYNIIENLEQIAVFPLLFILMASLLSPILFKKKISKAFFISLAVISIVVSYGIFLLDFFTGFTVNKELMVILPFPVIGIMIVSYFVAMITAIRGK